MNTALLHPDPDASHPDDTLLVLRNRTLRSGADLALTARFEHDCWPLGAAVLQQHCPSWQLNFASVPVRHRLVAKELLHAMLAGPLPPGEYPRSVSTICHTFAGANRFLTWLDPQTTTAGAPIRLEDVTEQHLEHYRRHLLQVIPDAKPEGRRQAQAAVRYFWRFRAALGTDRLRIDPRQVTGWSEPHNRAAENLTLRIPDQIHGPLLAWSLRFVNDFAPDILAACDTWATEHHPKHPLIQTDPAAENALLDLLAHHREQRQPLPGHHGSVNVSFLASRLGVSRTFLQRCEPQITATADDVGIAEVSTMSTTITGRLNGRPWISGFVSDNRHPRGLGTVARILQAACYVTIAFLSGMRDSEIKHLHRGCLRTHEDPTGAAYRWTLDSLAFKGERDPAGVPATWVVGQPVAAAISILERLQTSPTGFLFTALPYSGGAGPARRSANAALTSRTTNRQLNEFSRWINDFCAQNGLRDGIPEVAGRPFNLHTRQFRRTLAWFIARQPGGAIAGAIQYRHLSIQMFEGYAGTTDSGFRAEVDAEQALARGEHLLATINDHHHHDLVGPAADEGIQRLDDFAVRTSFQGQVITDPHRLKRLIQRHDPAIYPGTYATCVFNPDQALCLHGRRSTTPNTNDCKPLTCRNVALTADNITALQEEISGIDEHLRHRPLPPPLLQVRLTDRRDSIAEFLARQSQASA